MAYYSKFTGKQVDDILDSVSGKQDKLSGTNQVQKGQIADRAVEGKNVAINAITTSKIKDENVTTEKIAPRAITNPLIAESAISASKIANEAVQLQKLSTVVRGRLTTIIILSTGTDIANWSGTDAQFATTFGYSASEIITTAQTQAVLLIFKYQGKIYRAWVCTSYNITVWSVSFLIHDPEGLTELISLNRDEDNVTVTSETITFVNNNNDLLPVTLDTGKNAAFNDSQSSYTPAQFESAFGLDFTDLMQATDRPLLLKTLVSSKKCTMHAVSCTNSGNTMQISFIHDGTFFYQIASSDGGQTIRVQHGEFVTQLT